LSYQSSPFPSLFLAAEKKKDIYMIDAPVSGGVGGLFLLVFVISLARCIICFAGAEKGTLTFMVGRGSEEIFNIAKPILSLMGKNIVDCGSHGNGQVAKVRLLCFVGATLCLCYLVLSYSWPTI
jgi:3-hydroxyisobutyrate dehydrogenase